MASDEALNKIAQGLVERHICREAEADEVPSGNDGQPIYQGCFGMGKGKAVPNSNQEILRLNNLVPSDKVQKMIAGDSCTLPYLGQWGACAVEQGGRLDPVGLRRRQMLLLCLPPTFVLSKEVPGWVIG